jgi:hypothetical protein
MSSRENEPMGPGHNEALTNQVPPGAGLTFQGDPLRNVFFGHQGASAFTINPGSLKADGRGLKQVQEPQPPFTLTASVTFGAGNLIFRNENGKIVLG